MEKVGRNDPCPCGSGKKFKKCHGKQNSRYVFQAEVQKTSALGGLFQSHVQPTTPAEGRPSLADRIAKKDDSA